MLSGQGTRTPVRAVISRTRWVEDVARIELTHTLQLANVKGTLNFGVFGRNWEDNIKRHLQGIIFNKLGVIYLPQYRVRLWAVVDAVMNQFA
jgi:hypothetical protein